MADGSGASALSRTVPRTVRTSPWARADCIGATMPKTTSKNATGTKAVARLMVHRSCRTSRPVVLAKSNSFFATACLIYLDENGRLLDGRPAALYPQELLLNVLFVFQQIFLVI